MHNVSFTIRHQISFCITFISSRLLLVAFFPAMPNFSVLAECVCVCLCKQWIYAYACKVYFVEPTEQNIQKIAEDLSKNLYKSCYVGVFELCLLVCFLCMFPAGCVSCDAPKSSWPRSILQVQFRGWILNWFPVSQILGQNGSSRFAFGKQ